MNFSLLIKISSASLIIFSFLVIFLKNPIYSALSLVLSFITSSILVFFFSGEFFALLFLLIYSGAVLVLFLFVVMMLDLKHKNFKTNKFYLPVGFFFGALLAFKQNVEIFTSLNNYENKVVTLKHNYYFNWHDCLDSVSSIKAMSFALYEYYPAQTLLVGFLLYIVVLGVSHLTVNSRKINIKKTQSLTKQLTRRTPANFN